LKTIKHPKIFSLFTNGTWHRAVLKYVLKALSSFTLSPFTLSPFTLSPFTLSLFTLSLFTFIPFPARAQFPQAVLIDDAKTVYPLQEYSKYLRVPHDSLDMTNVLTRVNDFKLFNLSELNVDPYGAYDSWFMFTLKTKFKPIYLTLPIVQSYHLDLFRVSEGQLIPVAQSGINVPPDKKYINIAKDIFPLPLELNQETTYLLRINRMIYKSFGAEVYPPEVMLRSQYEMNFFEGLLIGIIMCVVLYHLLIFFITREREYILLTFYMFFLVLQVGTYSGHFNALFTIENTSWNEVLYNLIPCFSAIFSFWFSYVFLELNSMKQRWIKIVFNGFLILFIVSAIASLLNIPVLNSLTINASGVAAIFLFSVGIIRLRNHYKPAAIYLIAYIPSFISVPYLVYYVTGHVKYTWFTHNNLLLSIVLQAILFSLAIAQKIRLLKEENANLLQGEKEQLERMVLARTSELKTEKENVENLLLNILPLEVSEELKSKGYADARQFDEVTVMFTDFIDFTQISENLSPTDLVAEIHTCFKAFDEIITKYKIEKIKTIGDSYMCVGGLPVPNKTNAVDIINASIEIQNYMQRHREERRKEGKVSFEIRIGAHTGAVVAGIVGIKKFAYDIWGDTVNTASRMESSSEGGKINISESTYAVVKDKFKCTYRGKIVAKNKGAIDMYFVGQLTVDS
jgi:class 3 adenylate cyclase